MKIYLHIVVLLLLMVVGCARTVDDGVEEVVACTSNVETRHGTSLPTDVSPELAAIDSLMWRQPDSALQCIMTCRDAMLASPNTPDGDTMETHAMRLYNEHYYQLLLAELLYKNDWKQSNRENLLKAVGYFDSIVDGADGRNADARGKADAHGASLQRNAFLTARAHYINGVGFYEQGDVVNACAEYLKTLEMMEAHFKEQELVGHKARFLAYTYNRLGDLFSEQFMMESSITCYENALVYCKISPTSPIGVPNILYRIGKQYDKKNEIENASLYYGRALENLAETDNMAYRNIVANKALCDYKSGVATDSSLEELYYTLKCSDTEKERLNRYLTIGGIHFLERNYDSAIFYLEPVFEDNDAGLQAQAAGYLRIVYDSIGDVEKSNVYMRFLTNQKKPDGETKALVSKLEDLYKNYSNQKLEKQAEAEREIAKKKVLNTVVPIAIAIALAIFCVLIWRNRRQLKFQQKEADRELKERDKRHAEAIEAERQAHRMEQAAITGRLKRSNAELRELKDRMRQQNDTVTKPETQAASFGEEPICRLIMERVNEGQFKSQMDCTIYKDYALGKEQLLALREAADRHYNQFTSRLAKAYPELTRGDLNYCCLYLLGLSDADVAALMQKAYPTVSQRARKMKGIFGSEEALSVSFRNFAQSFE